MMTNSIDTHPNASVKIKATASSTSLQKALLNNLDIYFKALGNHSPNYLHRKVLEQAEEAMLAFLVKKTRNNQTKISQWLGLSRATTRKLMKRYGMLD